MPGPVLVAVGVGLVDGASGTAPLWAPEVAAALGLAGLTWLKGEPVFVPQPLEFRETYQPKQLPALPICKPNGNGPSVPPPPDLPWDLTLPVLVGAAAYLRADGDDEPEVVLRAHTLDVQLLAEQICEDSGRDANGRDWEDCLSEAESQVAMDRALPLAVTSPARGDVTTPQASVSSKSQRVSQLLAPRDASGLALSQFDSWTDEDIAILTDLCERTGVPSQRLNLVLWALGMTKIPYSKEERLFALRFLRAYAPCFKLKDGKNGVDAAIRRLIKLQTRGNFYEIQVADALSRISGVTLLAVNHFVDMPGGKENEVDIVMDVDGRRVHVSVVANPMVDTNQSLREHLAVARADKAYLLSVYALPVPAADSRRRVPADGLQLPWTLLDRLSLLPDGRAIMRMLDARNNPTNFP